MKPESKFLLRRDVRKLQEFPGSVQSLVTSGKESHICLVLVQRTELFRWESNQNPFPLPSQEKCSDKGKVRQGVFKITVKSMLKCPVEELIFWFRKLCSRTNSIPE